jgi:hypothetical protein
MSVTGIQGIQAQNREREIWASCGADWAYFLMQFLRGQRRLPIQLREIKQTHTYLRSSPDERQALEMVCDPEPTHPIYIEPESKRSLTNRDNFLMRYADSSTLERSDWVAQITQIPVLVAAREKGDQEMFPQAHYPITTLFSWVFEQR